MPYSPEELKEISKKLEPGEDPTLKVADKTGGGFDEDAQNAQYHPVIFRNEEILVRDDGSTLDWKNYRFEITFEDGTKQEFVFTAPDDGAAQKIVNDRIALVSRQKGTYKLSLVEAPKELFAGETGSTEATIKSNEKDSGEKSKKEARTDKQNEKYAEAKAEVKDKAKK